MESSQIKLAIKQILKNKHLTYTDLSDYLEVSHATVKRILTSEELTLSRLLQICEFLSLKLSELVAFADEETNPDVVTFTYEQELFLASDPRFYLYLSSLYSGQSPKQIAAKYKLDAASSDKYLLKLEQHELIKVTGKGNVKPTHPLIPEWMKHGPMGEFHVMNLVKSFSDFFTERIPVDLEAARKGDNKRKTGATIYSSPISRESFEKYREELHQVQEKWQNIANVEEKTKGEDNLGRQVFLQLTSWVETQSELGELENVLGEIENF